MGTVRRVFSGEMSSRTASPGGWGVWHSVTRNCDCTTFPPFSMPWFKMVPAHNSLQQDRVSGAIIGKETFQARGEIMNAPQSLHDKGQSLWLDNITRDILDNGTLKRYIDEWSISGLP